MTRKAGGDLFQEKGFSGQRDAQGHRGKGFSIAPSSDSIFLQLFREAITGTDGKNQRS
jgi:hypothetical protein